MGIFTQNLWKVFNLLVAKSGYQQLKSGSPSKFQVAWGYHATTKSYTGTPSMHVIFWASFHNRCRQPNRPMAHAFQLGGWSQLVFLIYLFSVQNSIVELVYSTWSLQTIMRSSLQHQSYPKWCTEPVGKAKLCL